MRQRGATRSSPTPRRSPPRNQPRNFVTPSRHPAFFPPAPPPPPHLLNLQPSLRGSNSLLLLSPPVNPAPSCPASHGPLCEGPGDEQRPGKWLMGGRRLAGSSALLLCLGLDLPSLFPIGLFESPVASQPPASSPYPQAFGPSRHVLLKASSTARRRVHWSKHH